MKNKDTLSLRLFELYDLVYFACSEEYKKTRIKISMGEWIRRTIKERLNKEE